uniref:Col_cuticle_N domain-containing protein n=1 Tax=Wuchereria bancrofti TaxID=6293 RepID=A0A1I8ENC5_WUCBA
MVNDIEIRERLLYTEKLKYLAFFGVATSAFTPVVCVMSIPLLYNYLQFVQTQLQTKTQYCKDRSLELFK